VSTRERVSETNREIFEKLGGFDDDYFMYYEETDLYWRLYNAGYKSKLLPNVYIIHLQGQSSTMRPNNNININKLNMLFRSRILFFRKNKPYWQIGLVKLFNLLSVLVGFYKYKRDLHKIVSIIIYNR